MKKCLRCIVIIFFLFLFAFSNTGCIKKEIEKLRTRLERLEAQGVDIAYPLVRLTVLEQFSQMIIAERNNGITDTHRQQVWELKKIYYDLKSEIESLEAGKVSFPVPRFVSSDIAIDNGAFWAEVQWNPGSGRPNERWPVIFSGYGHFESVIRDIELMPDYGCNIIQIEIGPNAVLPAENDIGDDEIQSLVAILDRASAANVAVNLLLSPDYFPQWAFEKWPEIKKETKLDPYITFFVDESNFHARFVIEEYLNILIPAIKDHPAIHSITLTNEPSYYNAIGDPKAPSAAFNRESYTAWLIEEYLTTSNAGAFHDATYASWDDVPAFYHEDNWVLKPANGTSVQRYEYFRFNDFRFADFHAWMGNTIHALAPHLPVHAKITDHTWLDPYDGVNPEDFVSLSQIAGNDSAKYYAGNDIEVSEANHYLNQNIFFDLLRSTGYGKPIFNSENHLIEDNETEVIPSSHIRNVLWQAAIHGQAASTAWLWERTVYDEEANENTKASIMNRPLNVVMYGRTGLDLLRLGKEINAFQAAPARVAIIYSATSLFYNEDYSNTMWSVYEALNCLGEKIDFITEAQLAAGEARSYEFVVAAEVSHMPISSYEGLSNNLPAEQLVFIGDSNFVRDSLDQNYTFLPPVNSTTLRRIDEAFTIREDLIPVIETAFHGRSVIVLDATDTSLEAFGVEWRSVDYNGSRLVNITNYNKDAVRVVIKGISETNRMDLMTGRLLGAVLKLAPLETLLISGTAESVQDIPN